MFNEARVNGHIHVQIGHSTERVFIPDRRVWKSPPLRVFANEVFRRLEGLLVRHVVNFTNHIPCLRKYVLKNAEVLNGHRLAGLSGRSILHELSLQLGALEGLLHLHFCNQGPAPVLQMVLNLGSISFKHA